MTDTPDVVMYQVPALVKDPYSPQYYSEALSTMFQGVVAGDGTWVSGPLNWTVTVEGAGLYRVTHSQANVHYSLNVGAVNGITSANVVQMVDNYFDIQVTDQNGNPTEAGFTFAVSFL
jgi:hypothetical protein